MNVLGAAASARRGGSARAWSVLLTGVLIVSVGCLPSGRDPRLAHLPIPPDFALNFFVAGQPDSRDPMRRPSRYVIEPDRRLRVTVGRDAGDVGLPPAVRTLGPEEFDQVVLFVQALHLTAEPTSPAAERSRANPTENAVVYHVEIYGRDRLHRYATTPAESPPTVQLLAQLVALSSTGQR